MDELFSVGAQVFANYSGENGPQSVPVELLPRLELCFGGALAGEPVVTCTSKQDALKAIRSRYPDAFVPRWESSMIEKDGFFIPFYKQESDVVHEAVSFDGKAKCCAAGFVLWHFKRLEDVTNG